MKNKSLITALIYWFLMLGLILFISGCRTKKSSIDSNTKELENVSIIDKSKTDKKESVLENSQETKTEKVTDKSFFESNTTITAEELTVTDSKGNTMKFKNPKYDNKSSQTSDVSKVEQTDSKSDKTSKSEEDQQSDVTIDIEKQIDSEFHSKDNRETKIVWLYLIGGAVLAVCFMFLVNKFLKKSN